MKFEVDTENVSYIDEYPHLAQKVRLQHLAAKLPQYCQVYVLPPPTTDPQPPLY